MNKRILVGSGAFFKDLPNFKSKDVDYVVFVERGSGYEWIREVITEGVDVFYVVKKSKAEIIN